jgi:hypothetical protein
MGEDVASGIALALASPFDAPPRALCAALIVSPCAGAADAAFSIGPKSEAESEPADEESAGVTAVGCVEVIFTGFIGPSSGSIQRGVQRKVQHTLQRTVSAHHRGGPSTELR